METFGIEGRRIRVRVIIDEEGHIFVYHGKCTHESVAFVSIIDDKTGQLMVFNKERICALEGIL